MLFKICLGIFIACILMLTVFLPQFKGDLGEIAVMRELNKLDSKNYKKIYDIKIKNPNARTKTCQIDHLILSKFGIFVIETKAYKGNIYGKEFSNKWIQYLGNKKYEFLNPLFQNYGHIKAVENILKYYYPNIKYFSILAFSGEANISKIKLKNANICKISNLSQTIKDLSKEKNLSNDDIKIIEKIIKENKSYQTDLAHVRDIKKFKKEESQKIRDMICPRCGGELVKRHGKYGEFLGCSNFPRCRFTYK